ncbi:2'-5' RNA ligase family protein [Flavobacteriaceae bacterium TP-CH-4]|uniref:2'-5' RNA ligase family protein n=1 Tax=Pelagihabitans pacificus TaxID=2696054 RepID=A0A967AV56_9FLAO|nr:2'-5' RNA ligase family protein [Pelagihabitans pacificus]NHF59960.1 2'-5' RNA ligase family protein [Pelagihabitans pacificus]
MRTIKAYNLRIVPPSPIFEEIVQFKQQFIQTFGKQPYSGSKPHITLAYFIMHEEYQDMLAHIFNQLSSFKKFKLNIEGFDYFENREFVLYLNVPMTKDLERIHKHIRILWQRDLHQKPGRISIPKTPHLTISKTKERELLHKSLSLFGEIPFSRQITVDHLTLVARPVDDTWDWEHTIPLSS